jgi:hypothetical protein
MSRSMDSVSRTPAVVALGHDIHEALLHDDLHLDAGGDVRKT